MIFHIESYINSYIFATLSCNTRSEYIKRYLDYSLALSYEIYNISKD